ncbi:hypothetical protein, partial [Thiorhodovibrio winogradskyi]
PLTTFADETIYLDASSGAVTIAGGATDGLTRYLDFGGEDIYTIPADLAGEAEVVDNQASTIILPAGLSIADTQFSSDGVYLRANGQGVTLLGQPAAFDFVFAGNADDPSLGVLRTFAKTAELFGATIPAAGASPVNGTVSGTINADGNIQAATAGLTPYAIDASNVDVFLPGPEISDESYQLQRSYQPYGDTSPYDLETAVLRAGEASVRLTQMKIDGENYWVDYRMALDGGNIILVSEMGLPPAPESFPYVGDFSALGYDFFLASADIFGPPARIRIFDVAIDYVLYDLDFTLVDNVFVLTDSTAKGYLNVMTMPDNGFIVFAGETNEATLDGSASYSLNLPNTPFQSPIAMQWDGADGEHSIRMEYDYGSRIQTMVATDGILLGEYLPFYVPQFVSFSASAPTAEALSAPNVRSKDVTVEEKLDQCIKNDTVVFVGLKADPQLSDAVVDAALTMASSLKLSNSTLDKIKDTIGDSKDLILEVMANGKVDSTTLGVFVSTTIMKNATTQEQKQIVEQIWGNNVPNDVATLAKSAGAAETNAKLAMQALAEGIASKVFPAYTAAVKLVIKTADYAKDALGNDAFRQLYDLYAETGDWSVADPLSALGTNKFADSTIREILRSQKKPSEDKDVERYLKDKIESLYARKSELPEERAKLNLYKDDYLELAVELTDGLKSKFFVEKNPSTCDMFHEYLNVRSRVELNLKNSLRNCESFSLTESDIRSKAEVLARYWIRSGKASRAQYQAEKLSWLQANNCLNFEDDSETPPITEHGVWALADKIVYSDPDVDIHECFQKSVAISDGSYSLTNSVSGELCNWKFSESITFTGSWTSPPPTLVPGQSYSASMDISRSNHLEQFGASDFIDMQMDNYEMGCGSATASKIDINTVEVGWRASDPSTDSWSGSFEAPGFGYAGSGETKKFQILAGGYYGCVRYIYEWQE